MAVNWDAINAIGQAAGALGVIITLLYLAAQVREDARSRRAATVHQQLATHANGLHTIATHGDLAAIFARGIFDLEMLSAAERARFSAMLGYLFLNFEDSFFQHAEKHLDERVWHGISTPLGDLLAYPGVRAWWNTRLHHYSRDFRSFVDAKIASDQKPNLYPARFAPEAAASATASGEIMTSQEPI